MVTAVVYENILKQLLDPILAPCNSGCVRFTGTSVDGNCLGSGQASFG